MGDNSLVEVKEVDELESILRASQSSPILIMKHSLTCPISDFAYRQVKQFMKNPIDGVAYKLIIVQHARPASDAAARDLGVVHESPQAIIVRDGKAVWNASHYDITEENLREALTAQTQ